MKRDTFLGYKDLITPKHAIFSGYSFHKWNVRWAYAIRPYLVTQKHDTFSIPHTYPANFPGLGRGLDFLLPSFLVSRQGPYRGRKVFPGTFLGWILYSSLFFDPFSSFLTYPAIFPGLGRGLDFLLPSFLVSRQEKKVEVVGIRPIERYSKNGKCMKRVNFSGYNDRAI